MYADSCPGELTSQRLREPTQRELGRRVRDVTWVADRPEDRAGVENPGALPGLEVWQQCSAKVKRCVHVHCDGRVDLLRRLLLEQHEVIQTSIVDQRIDATTPAAGHFAQPGAICWIGEIRHDYADPVGVGAQRIPGGMQQRDVPINEKHLGPVTQQLGGNCAADASATSGDQRLE